MDRKQRLIFNGVTYTWHSVNKGTTQGSVSGPHLLVIRDLKHQDGRGGRRLTGSEKSHFDSSAHANRLHHPVLPSSST